jgi:hypothetical protein
MRRAVKQLLGSRRRRYLSQAGEAGILEELFRRLHIERGYIAEVGASDGIFLSNTNQFVGRGYRIIYIEADATEFEKLQANFAGQRDVLTVHRHVAPTGPDSLDAVLGSKGLPPDFDLLVIDIDSYDVALLREMRLFRPKILMLEYNPFFFPHEEHEATSGELHPERGGKGSSLAVVHRVAVEKGYGIACTLNMNAIFVRVDLLPLVYDRPPTLEETATFEFLPVRKLAPRQLLQRAYYLGLSRVLHSLAIKAGLMSTFQYPSRERGAVPRSADHA